MESIAPISASVHWRIIASPFAPSPQLSAIRSSTRLQVRTSADCLIAKVPVPQAHAVLPLELGIRLRSLLPHYWLMCSEHRSHFRFGWNDDPRQQIRDDPWANSGGEGNEHPQDTHQRHIQIEILSQTGTNTRNLFVASEAHQPLRRRRRTGHTPAVGAKANVLSNGLAATVAIHACSPCWLKIRGQAARCSVFRSALSEPFSQQSRKVGCHRRHIE